MNLVVLRIHAFIMNSRGGSLDDDTNSYYNMDSTNPCRNIANGQGSYTKHYRKEIIRILFSSYSPKERYEHWLSAKAAVNTIVRSVSAPDMLLWNPSAPQKRKRFATLTEGGYMPNHFSINSMKWNARQWERLWPDTHGNL